MKSTVTYALVLGFLAFSCATKLEKETYQVILEDPENLAQKAQEAKAKLPIKLAAGLQMHRWASDSLAPDPVAMDIDAFGAVYINRTNRQKNSEFDIRGYRQWMTESISFQTVEDRRAFLRRTFAPEKSEQNSWLKDLNGDGSHDWRDLAVEKEEVWKIEDKDGDGFADRSSRIFNGFNEEITDVAGGVLIRKKDAFIAVGPDLWRLDNTHKKGLLTNPTSISHGYGVHIGFGGHGMSGLTEGPDGKIYWQIGDIGANITDLSGKQYPHPNSGVIVRSNPDGSNFEVFAHGLRNTHEFVFDAYGNLISADNDGDHPGESERLVHVVEGSDAGWRSNWQYGKYTDPKNNLYKVWMNEKLYVPRWEGQAAYIIPPIRNFHNGPTGMLFNPGTALGKAWLNKFFLVEFVGAPTRSHIWAFDLSPKGASFDFKSEVDVLSGVLPTGIRFSPDGALFAADWVNGWDSKNFGRIWKIDVAEDKNDLKEARAKTKELMAQDFDKLTAEVLYEHLFDADQRIRRKAQFALATQKAKTSFLKAIQQKDHQLARIHGIWGIGQLADPQAQEAQDLIGLLQDTDTEIQAQAAKVLGDVRLNSAIPNLIPLLSSNAPRVQFFAAQALGRMQAEAAIPALLDLIKQNQDKDLYLRHAAVLALSRIGKQAPIVALNQDPNRSLRLAAVLVLRRWKSEDLRLFLNDREEYIVTEAARAINDDESVPSALPALAALLNEPRFKEEALIRRAINACLRVGGAKEIQALLQYAANDANADALRAEALATLGSWADPSVLDRVDGRYRGKLDRDPKQAAALIADRLMGLVKHKNPEIQMACARMLGDLGIQQYRSEQTQLFLNHPDTRVRLAHFNALIKLKDDHLPYLVQRSVEDTDKGIRSAALANLNQVNLNAKQLAQITQPVFEKGSIAEQQSLLKSLGQMGQDRTESLMQSLIDRMVNNQLPKEIRLDLVEAVEKINAKDLTAKLDALKTNQGSALDAYRDALYGGDLSLGNTVFFRNQAAQCTRCHNVNGEAGGAGPSLKGVASRLSREQLLEALIEPSARIAPGYGTVTIKLNDGQEHTGTLISENEHEIQLKTGEAEPLKLAVSRIKSRENYPSAMPAMGGILSKREIRDVVEYLSSLKK